MYSSLQRFLVVQVGDAGFERLSHGVRSVRKFHVISVMLSQETEFRTMLQGPRREKGAIGMAGRKAIIMPATLVDSAGVVTFSLWTDFFNLAADKLKLILAHFINIHIQLRLSCPKL